MLPNLCVRQKKSIPNMYYTSILCIMHIAFINNNKEN